jgi:hypothetical protein
MKKTVFGFAAAVAALVVAGSANAQACAGFPTQDGEGSIGALANFPSGFDQYGAEGSFNLYGPLAANAGYVYSKDGDDHLSTIRGGLALDVNALVGGTSSVSICPNVRADYSFQDGTTLWEVPIGVGFGATLPVGGPDMTLTPYVIPALVWMRSSAGANTSESNTELGVRGGATLNFDRFYLGGTVEWVNGPTLLSPDKKAIFGVRAGIKF